MQQQSYINRGNYGAGFEHWHDMTCRQFSTTECDIPNEPNFNGEVKSWSFGALHFGDVSARTGGVHLPLVRSAQDIRRDPRDHIMLVLIQSGEIGFLQADRNTTAKPGDIVLYDQANPFTVNYMGNARSLIVAVPRHQAVSRLEQVADFTARRLPSASYAARFFRSILSELQSSADADAADFSPKLESSALDLMFSSVEQCFLPDAAQFQGHRQGQLNKIKRYMLDNLQDTDLSIDRVCAMQGVSPRSLNRLFSSEGMTPMRWLWKQRLEASYKVIAQGQPVSITNIAYDYGFRDVSHFSRAFKREFGRSPSAVLLRK